jgi:hypothetical protein
MSDEVAIVNLSVGAFNGATELPLAHIPLQWGGVTVLEATLFSPSAGTVIGGQLVTMGTVPTGGTPAINGTLGTLAGTVVTAAGIVHKFTLTNYFVAAGYYLGFDQTSGTVPAGTYIQAAFVMGK